MIISNNNWLQELMQKLIGDKEQSENFHTVKPADVNQGFKSPIKGAWKISGLFSPGVATDKRHPKGHDGIDMRAPGGTPIYPMAPGIVSDVSTDSLGGNVIYVQHDNNIKTYYAHCSTITAHKGDKVDYDTEIAKVGDSGNAKGTLPHCHFQVWENGALQNPAKYFNVPAYTIPTKDEKMWTDDESKQNASTFTIEKHNKLSNLILKINLFIKLAQTELWKDPKTEKPVLQKFEAGDLVRNKTNYRDAVVISYAPWTEDLTMGEKPKVAIHYLKSQLMNGRHANLSYAKESDLVLIKSKKDRLEDPNSLYKGI